jgi:virginiamycin B lyase
MPNLNVRLQIAFLFLLAVPFSVGGETGVFLEFPLPSAAAGASGIVSGPDGGWWFTEFAANNIGRVFPGGQVTEFPIPTPNSGPLGIVAVYPDIWFTEFNANKIGKITTDGVITEFPIPTPASGPIGIDTAFDSVYFCESKANQIGRLSFAGTFTEIPIPTPNSVPIGIVGAIDTLWFAESQGNKIGIVSLRSGINTPTLTETSIPTPNSGPSSVSYDDAGRVWFTETNANKIGVLDGGGNIADFAVPTSNSGATGISADFFAGVAWFTERSANKIGSMTTDGRFTEYPIPTASSDPLGITVFGGQAFFTERSGNAIGRVEADALVFAAAVSLGGWNTEFDVANVENQSIDAFAGDFYSPRYVCPGPCVGQTSVQLSPHGSGRMDSGVFFTGTGFPAVFVRALEDGVLPSVKARFVNSDVPSRSVDVPGIRLSSLAKLDPTTLVFPTALKTRGGGHSNALITEVSYGAGLPGSGLEVMVEVFSGVGDRLGSSLFDIEAGGSLYLVDVVAQLGIAELDLGQVRLTRVAGTGLMWGYLITSTDEGSIGVSIGANP